MTSCEKVACRDRDKPSTSIYPRQPRRNAATAVSTSLLLQARAVFVFWYVVLATAEGKVPAHLFHPASLLFGAAFACAVLTARAAGNRFRAFAVRFFTEELVITISPTRFVVF